MHACQHRITNLLTDSAHIPMPAYLPTCVQELINAACVKFVHILDDHAWIRNTIAHLNCDPPCVMFLFVVCFNNTITGDNTSCVNGVCQCKPGYLQPNCCECDTTMFFGPNCQRKFDFTYCKCLILIQVYISSS